MVDLVKERWPGSVVEGGNYILLQKDGSIRIYTKEAFDVVFPNAQIIG